MTEALLFASAFGLVFLLGLQSLNVNGGHYLAAAYSNPKPTELHATAARLSVDADRIRQAVQTRFAEKKKKPVKKK